MDSPFREKKPLTKTSFITFTRTIYAFQLFTTRPNIRNVVFPHKFSSHLDGLSDNKLRNPILTATTFMIKFQIYMFLSDFPAGNVGIK